MQKVELDEQSLKLKFNKIIVTYGAEGSQVIDTQETLHVPAVLTDDIVDTT
jgi:sugar/nucleoside kinase (ribokinase family)